MADDTVAPIDPAGLGVAYPPVNPFGAGAPPAPAPAPAPATAADPAVVTIDLSDTAPVAAPAAAADPDVVVVEAPAAEGDALPDGAALQKDGSVVLTLRYPVTMKWKSSNSDAVTEETRTQFRFYRLTGADMKVMLNSGSSNNVVLGLARSCRMAVGVFDKLFERMDGSDARAAAEVLGFFFGAGVPTPSGPPASR